MTDFLTSCETAPECISTRSILVGDATLKGIRTHLYNSARCAVSSDEAWSVTNASVLV